MRDIYEEFERLRRQMVAMAATCDLHHGIVVTGTPLGPNRERVIATLQIHVSRDSEVESIVLPLTNGTVQEHVFFDTDQRSFEAFRNALHGIESLLSRLPATVIPNVAVPKVRDAANRRVTKWICLLYHIAWTAERPHICAEALHSFGKYDQLIGQVIFEPYDSLQPLEGFDIRPLITLVGCNARSFAEWTQDHEQAQVEFPSRFAAYLTKNVFYASSHAIDYLMLCSRTLEATGRSSSTTAQTARYGKRTKDGLYLLDSLLAQHRSGHLDGLPKDEPLTQEQIAQQLKWSQPKVHRMITKLYGNMHSYRLKWREPNRIARSTRRLFSDADTGYFVD